MLRFWVQTTHSAFIARSTKGTLELFRLNDMYLTIRVESKLKFECHLGLDYLIKSTQ